MYCHPSLQWPVYLHAAGNSITFAVITPGLHCVFKDQAVRQDYPSFQCAYVKLVFVAVIIPGLHSAFKCQAIIQDYPSFQCAYVQLSPWYNRTGWLGVKHQLTYLLIYVQLLSVAVSHYTRSILCFPRSDCYITSSITTMYLHATGICCSHYTRSAQRF